MKIRPSAALGALALMLLIGSTPAVAADGPREILGLLHQGKTGDALVLAIRLANQQPRDAELQLLKGVTLAELGRQEEALAVFLKMTQDFPDQPEPYNNLAVLYARQKQYDKARNALESAIRTHPSYAVAHQNLGDVYARLASQAYERALQPDSGRSNDTPARLALITEMNTRGNTMPPHATAPVIALVSPAVPPAPVAAPIPAPVAAPAPTVVATAPPAPLAKPAPAAVVPPPAPSPAAAVTPAPAVEAPVTTKAVPAEANAAETIVLHAVESWARAWARKDVKAYLAAYDQDFDVPDGRSRAAWERERQQRVGKPGNISVEVENPRVTVSGDRAVVRFLQRYRSSGFNASTMKTLELVRHGDVWRIRREQAGG